MTLRVKLIRMTGVVAASLRVQMGVGQIDRWRTILEVGEAECQDI